MSGKVYLWNLPELTLKAFPHTNDLLSPAVLKVALHTSKRGGGSEVKTEMLSSQRYIISTCFYLTYCTFTSNDFIHFLYTIYQYRHTHTHTQFSLLSLSPSLPLCIFLKITIFSFLLSFSISSQCSPLHYCSYCGWIAFHRLVGHSYCF